jgi:hypothetical protein
MYNFQQQSSHITKQEKAFLLNHPLPHK